MVTAAGFHRVIDGKPYRAEQAGTEIIVSTEGNPEGALADVQWRLAEPLPRAPLYDLAEEDPRVAGLVNSFPGVRPPLVKDPFESIITSISAQQVNLTWATTTRRRLIETFGRACTFEGITVWEFPHPERLAGVDPSALRALQFTSRKSEYIVEVARVAADGKLDDLAELEDHEIIERVTALRGVGRWTADWLLARCLARPRAVAAGDLGVRKAVSFSYLDSDHILSEDVVRDTVGQWGDAANLTAHLLLETLV